MAKRKRKAKGASGRASPTKAPRRSLRDKTWEPKEWFDADDTRLLAISNEKQAILDLPHGPDRTAKLVEFEKKYSPSRPWTVQRLAELLDRIDPDIELRIEKLCGRKPTARTQLDLQEEVSQWRGIARDLRQSNRTLTPVPLRRRHSDQWYALRDWCDDNMPGEASTSVSKSAKVGLIASAIEAEADAPVKDDYTPDRIGEAILKALGHSPARMTREQLLAAVEDVCATVSTMRPRVIKLLEEGLINEPDDGGKGLALTTKGKAWCQQMISK